MYQDRCKYIKEKNHKSIANIFLVTGSFPVFQLLHTSLKIEF